MWSFFSRDPARDFGYEIGTAVHQTEGCSLWQLHEATRKGTSQKVSVFVVRDARDTDSRLSLAKSALKRYKTLRHPGIVRFVDALETDDTVYLVTESVTPLEQWLQQTELTPRQKRTAITWGLLQITKVLAFLNVDGRLSHNNVCLSSIYVDAAAEWKLAGLEFVTAIDSCPPEKLLTPLRLYDPPEGVGLRAATPAFDAWGLGCLIWECYNGPLQQRSQLKSKAKIPKEVRQLCSALLVEGRDGRSAAADVLQTGSKPDGAFSTDDVRALQFVEELQIKDAAQKERFLGRITSILDHFPTALCKNKILPQLVATFEFGSTGPTILTPIFKLGTLLDDDEYQLKIVPCLVKMFSSTDRQTRVKLLQQLDSFVEHLQPNTVNQQVFPHLVGGFTDSSAVLREHTVRACVLLAPKLNFNNLNVELLKYLARLQAKDEEGGIRTNTTVCIGKLAEHLDPGVRQKVLKSAFIRALKDPFPPSRSAGVLGLASAVHFFTLAEVAERVLPCLCALTLDPELQVRQQVFHAISSMIDRLETVSKQPELRESMEADVNKKPAGGSSGWAGWAVETISSVYHKQKPKSDKPVEEAVNPSDKKSRTATKSAELVEQLSSLNVNTNRGESTGDRMMGADDRLMGTTSSADCEGDDEGGGGWDEENWDDLEVQPSNGDSQRVKQMPGNGDVDCYVQQQRADPSHSSTDGWDDFSWQQSEPDASAICQAEPSVSGRRRDGTSERTKPPRATGPLRLGARKL